ncbi:hypothetical protein cyc_07367 [Cyclospora cayetanensis]|uniref:Uncharacterized protein n=1 Tax=Cyclospora cayetanensis TaxID=88456 RepID=A0A1D3CZA7_9EIME|nr:hypothetical protein cyc_07367 [Cyclospora cayetanensis]
MSSGRFVLAWVAVAVGGLAAVSTVSGGDVARPLLVRSGYGNPISCVTPSIPVKPSKEDYQACLNEYTIGELTDHEWFRLKWGNVGVMCRASTQFMSILMEDMTRHPVNPFRTMISTLRRIAGSIDSRSVTIPLNPRCECNPRSPTPIFTSVHENEQFIKGVKVLSHPRSFYEFFPNKSTCEAPFDFTQLLGVNPPAMTTSAAPALQGMPLYEFREIQSCTWRVTVLFEPRVLASRNEIKLIFPSEVTSRDAAGVPASKASDAILYNGGLPLTLPPGCQMRNVPIEFRAWIRSVSLSAQSLGNFQSDQLRQHHPYQQQLLSGQWENAYELTLQVETSGVPLGPLEDIVHYHHVPCISDFNLATERSLK